MLAAVLAGTNAEPLFTHLTGLIEPEPKLEFNENQEEQEQLGIGQGCGPPQRYPF